MAKKKRIKKAWPYFVLAIVFFVVICALYVHEDNEDGSVIRAYTSYPRITTQEELLEAFNGPKANYSVEGISLSGTPVNDGLGIMAEEYLFLNYDCQLLTKKLVRGEDGYPMLQGQWILATAKCWSSMSDTILLAEGVALDGKSVKFEYGGYGELNDTNCVEAVWDQLENGFYYPDGMEEEEGDRRYIMHGIKLGDTATFAATIGEGELEVLPVNEEPFVLINGTVDELVQHVYDEQDATVRLVILLVLSFDLVFWGMGIFHGVRNLKRRRKKRSDTHKEEKV